MNIIHYLHTKEHSVFLLNSFKQGTGTSNKTLNGWMDNKQPKVRSWIFQAWKNAEREKMSNNKKTNLSWRHSLAIQGCFLTLCLFFIMQSQQFFLLLWWNSHNGRYWLLYFLSVYPPLTFVIAEQEDILGRGNADPAEFEHFLSNNWKSLYVGGAYKVQEDSYEVPEHQVRSGYVKDEQCFWSYVGTGVRYAVWSARAWELWLLFWLTCHQYSAVFTSHNSKVIPIWLWHVMTHASGVKEIIVWVGHLHICPDNFLPVLNVRDIINGIHSHAIDASKTCGQ